MTDHRDKTSILFVCMGNICRSPTAEGVFRHHVELAGMAESIDVDSAGTHAYHVGEPADRRARAAAERRGISLEGIAARRVDPRDFERFDHILAMDEDNLARLHSESPDEHRHKLRLFLDFADSDQREVPDPYYGGDAGFERVLDLVEDASLKLLESLRRS
jgi:protein-tyrosine phosphatase